MGTYGPKLPLRRQKSQEYAVYFKNSECGTVEKIHRFSNKADWYSFEPPKHFV